MERLTKRLDDGQAVMDCQNCDLNSLQSCTCLACRNRLKDRLAAYEDAGLTPEEVKDMDENAETSLLTWFMAKYGFPVGSLMDFCEAKQQGRLVVLDKPMLPLVWGDDNHETILCPNCNNDLMGGFQFAEDCETVMFQCPYCGQPIDTTKTVEK